MREVTIIVSKPPWRLPYIDTYERLILYHLNGLDHEVEGSNDLESFNSVRISGVQITYWYIVPFTSWSNQLQNFST